MTKHSSKKYETTLRLSVEQILIFKKILSYNQNRYPNVLYNGLYQVSFYHILKPKKAIDYPEILFIDGRRSQNLSAPKNLAKEENPVRRSFASSNEQVLLAKENKLC